MWVVIVCLVGFLIAFWLVLFTVHRMRPETFRLKATLTKWISFDLEMRSPQCSSGTRLRLARDLDDFPRHGRPPS